MTTYCVFNIGERRVGLPMAHVREILEPQLVRPQPVPLTPSFLRGLFNLRGQIVPYLDLASFVGVQTPPGDPARDDRAVIVERGAFRFAINARRVATLEADPATFQPLPDAALHPALDTEARTDRGHFHVIHLDRLEACLTQAMKKSEIAPVGGPNTETGNPKSEAPLPRSELPDPN